MEVVTARVDMLRAYQMRCRISAALPLIIVLQAFSGESRREVTYSHDIVPILYNNCVVCHCPGNVAPFSLLTYEDACKHAKVMARVTKDRYMPPWKAVSGIAEFSGIRPLTPKEIATIAEWVDSGMPRGDPAEAPAPPEFAQGWSLGVPDLVLTMPQPYTVPADGNDIYQCFVVPLNLLADRYLVGFEYRPGNRKLVHHAILSRDNTGEAQRKDAEDPDVGFRTHDTGTGLSAGYNSVIGVWTPGIAPALLPEGVGLKIEKGAVLVLQNHYHPTGKTETDQSTVAFYFSKKPPEQLAYYTTIHQQNIHIPPGEKHFIVTDSDDKGGNRRVLSIQPHMHFLGQEMRVTLTDPDGAVKHMIYVKDWDFKWQTQYFYKYPMRVLKGSRIDMQAWFDNSADNPRNPYSPPRWVHYGPNSTDEMAAVVLLMVDDNPYNRRVGRGGEAAMDACVGVYKLNERESAVITREFGVLMAKIGDKRKVDLYPESDERYFSRYPDMTFKFKKNSAGFVISLDIISDGIAQHAERH